MAKSYPKFNFRNRLPEGDYLTLSVWPGKKDPTAEVITIQIRRLVGDNWTTAGRLAVYRTSDGIYSQLPERPPPQRMEEKEVKTFHENSFLGDDFLSE